MKALLPDLTVTRYFHSSCSCTPLKFPEELGKACSVSTQVWKVCFHCVIERRFHVHENLGLSGSAEGGMTTQLDAIHLPEEIKNILAN